MYIIVISFFQPYPRSLRSVDCIISRTKKVKSCGARDDWSTHGTISRRRSVLRVAKFSESHDLVDSFFPRCGSSVPRNAPSLAERANFQKRSRSSRSRSFAASRRRSSANSERGGSRPRERVFSSRIFSLRVFPVVSRLKKCVFSLRYASRLNILSPHCAPRLEKSSLKTDSFSRSGGRAASRVSRAALAYNL